MARYLSGFFLAILCISDTVSDILGPYKLQSKKYPTHKWGFDPETRQLNLHAKGSRFYVHSPGLTQEEGVVSIESADKPGYFLCQSEANLHLEPRLNVYNPQALDKNYTFRLLEGYWEDGYFSLESLSSPKLYIRQREYSLSTEQNEDSEQFTDDASFRAIDGPFYLQSYNMGNYTIGLQGTEAYMTEEGHAWNLVLPGLTQTSGTLSLESATQPDHYLRHGNQLVDLEKRDPLANPGEFDADSTFYKRDDMWFGGYFAMESENTEQRFIRHAGSRIRLNPFNDSSLYKRDASYRTIERAIFLDTYTSPGYRIGLDPVDSIDLVVSLTGERFNVIYPGLGAGQGTVSLERARGSGSYLVARGQIVQLLIRDDASDKAQFDTDASFLIREDLWYPDTVAFESFSRLGWFVIREDMIVRLGEATPGDNDFQQAASFRRATRVFEEVETGEPRLLQSYNYPTHMVGYTLELRAFISQRGRRLKVHSPGLTGAPGTVSLESADRPTHFLRHADGQLVLESQMSPDNPVSFLEDATFILWTDKYFQGYVAVESINKPNFYIRHVNYQMRLDQEDSTDLFQQDASFRLVEGPYWLQSRNFPAYQIGVDGSQEAYIRTDGESFYLVRPGLTGLPDTLSLEVQDKPGYYLRHYSYNMDLEDIDDPRNPGVFLEDATFNVTVSGWYFQGYFGMESVNYPDHFIRHQGYRLKINQYEDTQLFRNDASYRAIQGPMYLESYNYRGHYLNVNSENHAYISSAGHRFHLVHPGLSGEPGTASLEYVVKPGFYIRAYNDVLNLEDREAPDNPGPFDSDASFYVREDLWFDNVVSLESSRYAGYYIRHSGYRLRLNKDDGSDLFHRDASFHKFYDTRDPGSLMVIGPLKIQSYDRPDLKLSFNMSKDVNLDETGRRFYLQTPGLANQPDTVSLLSADWRDCFVRHYGYLLDVESHIEARNPHVYNQDATFRVKASTFKGYYRFESFNYPDHYVTHEDGRLKIATDDGSTTFSERAAFRLVDGPFFLEPQSDLGRRVGVDNNNNKATVTNQGDMVYIIQPGLVGENMTFSIELASRPGTHLRKTSDADVVFEARPEDGDTGPYDYDSSFHPNIIPSSVGFYSVETMQKDNTLLTVSDSRLILRKYSDNAVPSESAFRALQGPFKLISHNYGNHSIGFNSDGEVSIQTDGSLFSLVYPGVNGAKGTVSVESVSRPGFYLRHRSFLVELAQVDNNASALLRADASFWPREDLWFQSRLVLECVNNPAHFLRHQGYRMRASLYDETDLFRQDASFIKVFLGVKPEEGSQTLSGGAIAGIVLGTLLGVTLLVTLLVFLGRRYDLPKTFVTSTGIENPTYEESHQHTGEIPEGSSGKSVHDNSTIQGLGGATDIRMSQVDQSC